MHVACQPITATETVRTLNNHTVRTYLLTFNSGTAIAYVLLTITRLGEQIMKTSLTTTGHLAVTSVIIGLMTVALPGFLKAMTPGTVVSLLASKQVQIQWLQSMLEAMN